MQNRKLNKIRTVLAVLLMAFSIFSVAYISLEKNHDCSGDDCPICYVINVAEQNLKLLSFAAFFSVIIRHFSTYKKSILKFTRYTYLKSYTLISQKIRLND